MSDHTPGPWRWEHFANNESYLLDADGASIVEGSIVTASDDEHAANARLIAAAPDLLAACEEMSDACAANDWSEPGVSDDLYNALEQMRAAIAKARGQTE